MDLTKYYMLYFIGLCWSLLFVSSELVVNRDGQSVLTFRELAVVPLVEGYSFGTIISMAEDDANPGAFLIGTLSNVAIIAANKTIHIVAGHEDTVGFRNGDAKDSLFTTVQDMTHYYAEGTQFLLITDTNNHCIRKLNRQTNIVTTFIGKCETAGKITRNTRAADTLLDHPIKTLYIRERSIIYYLLQDSILKHDLDTERVQLMYKSVDGSFGKANSFVKSRDNSYLYVAHVGGVWRFSTDTWQTRLIVSSRESQAYLSGLAWLIPDQILLLVYNDENELAVTNLIENTVSPICRGDNSTDPTYVLNGDYSCKFLTSTMLAVLGDTIIMGYLADEQFGYLLQLKYSQPLCRPPSLENGRISPIQPEYYYLQAVLFLCDEGYVLNKAYGSLQCEANYYANGTVYGHWDKLVPHCQRESTLTSIRPEKGQQAGGTLVTLTGYFSSSAEISVEQGEATLKVETLSQNETHIEFAMPAAKRNISPRAREGDEAVINVIINKGLQETTVTGRYRYIADPIINDISRIHSFSSGGLLSIFTGEHLSSAYSYQWKFYQNGGGTAISTVNCFGAAEIVSSWIVGCRTPSISDSLLSAINSTDFLNGSTKLTATLYGDNVAVAGAKRFSFFLIPFSPEIYRSAELMEYNSAEETPIELHGQHLKKFLYTTDYNIYLTVIDIGNITSIQPQCKVTELDNSKVLCIPDPSALANIFNDSEAEDFTAYLQVKVGNLVYENVQIVKVYKADSLTSRRMLIIALSVAIPAGIVVIIIALVVFFKYRKRLPAEERVEKVTLDYFLEDGEEKRYCQIHREMNQEVLSKIKRMYIEPSTLSFNRTTDLIGKGSFGKVYLGQLHCKNNILKSVAVKTLKETEQVSVEQIEGFLEEAAFLQNFMHVNILVTLGVVWRDGGRPLAILPYMALGDLCSLIRKPTLELTNGDLIHFALQISTGMEYLTKQRCLHRDLATRNCLVNEECIVKIADFGMSKDVYSENYYRETNRDKPKPVKWMAIESLREGVYNSSTEVWAFGVLMWELFTRGSMPYPGISNGEMLLYLSSGQRLSKPTHTCREVFDVVKQCWDKNPSSRPTFTELKDFLAQCLQLVDDSSKLFKDYSTSYTRSFTKDVPPNYSDVASFCSHSTKDIIYVDNSLLYSVTDTEESISIASSNQHGLEEDRDCVSSCDKTNETEVTS